MAKRKVEDEIVLEDNITKDESFELEYKNLEILQSIEDKKLSIQDASSKKSIELLELERKIKAEFSEQEDEDVKLKDNRDEIDIIYNN